MNLHPEGLSAVMIVRDAKRTLGESLSALTPVADEIVVVDTGSADGTLEIARQYRCRIFPFAWVDDFSQARNFSLEQARFRWVLCVDSDEVLESPDDAGAILRAAMAEEAAPAYLVLQENHYDDCSVKPNPVLRFFRNDPRIRFTNPVHECVSGTLFTHWPHLRLQTLDVRLRHTGYQTANLKGKAERNLALLERWVAAEPGHLFANFKLGGQLLDLGRSEAALHHLERVYRLFCDPRYRRAYPFWPTFVVLYHRVLQAAGREAQAQAFERIATAWLEERRENPR